MNDASLIDARNPGAGTSDRVVALRVPFVAAMPLLILCLLGILPWLTQALDADYYLGFTRRVLIISLAVVSLNLLIGYGGLVTLGHAASVGIGAYTVAALTHAGMTSGWSMLALAIVTSASIAAVTASIALRTRGMYFIMITLACAQLLYYVVMALRIYGSDDGYTLPAPLKLGFGATTADKHVFYWVVLGVSAACFMAISHLMNSRFGAALCATRNNEQRMEALGYSVKKIQFAAFVLAGAIAGLAGALLIAHNGFVTPAVMHWTYSANLVVMLVIGGLGYRWGGVVGVVVWLVLEEVLRQLTNHWHLPLGIILIALVLLAPRGLCSLLPARYAGEKL
jgi:branched-chain amino acid transport system permease protein